MSPSGNTAFGYTIFCDDVREEVGGKLSMVGVYRGSLQVHSPLPATLPKFGLVIHYAVPLEAIPVSDVDVRIWFPGDPEEAPSFVVTLQLSKVVVPTENEANPDGFLTIGSVLMFAPLTLKETGSIRVRAFAADKVVRLGSLKIEQRLAPETESADGAQ